MAITAAMTMNATINHLPRPVYPDVAGSLAESVDASHLKCADFVLWGFESPGSHLDVGKKAGSVGGLWDPADGECKRHDGVVVGACRGFASS